ncbi:N-acetylmuramoyl-L-alanine amidase family protein [Neosynechococcus sphagnicola]|uniref:N-acetylmuramoyl-L-alanine amidase family protein n=1 Tax=Neosynechococcus sphagnicola TaxID=1501145 RepID=UPI00068F4B99|nr:N-acetylmuramoyl-L-alanine amidase [Neosynechococcus sphagnicola]
MTPDGFFVRVSGANPQVQTQRSRDRRQITYTFTNAILANRVPRRDLIVNRFGVSRVQVTDSQAVPPSVQITLFVERKAPNWEARISTFGSNALGGVALVPVDTPQRTALNPPYLPTPNRPPDPPPLIPPPSYGNPDLATIQAIDLGNNDSQLLIQASRSVVYTSGWDRSAGAYRINLPARLAAGIRTPRTGAGSPILRLQLRQEDSRTVTILVYPAAGIQIGDINQPNPQLVALELTRTQSVQVPPPLTRPLTVPPPVNSYPPPNTSYPPISQPRPPKGRLVVVIDPGHGGPDVGAVGIGGIWEKNIVLDVSRQVADLLERQGIQAVLTRPDDRDLDLEPRVQIARQVNATIFVSIHANSINLSRPDISGIETYYYATGARLAQVLHRNILQGTGAKDRGVRTARFYVIRRTTMPSVLLEIGFVTGQEDASRLSTAAYRSQMAAAIARGILEYLQSP